MAVAGAQGGISDVKLRWSHLMNGTVHTKKKGGETFPALAALISHVVSPDLCQHSVLIKVPDSDIMYEIRQWLEEHARAKYSIFGRYAWTDFGVRVARDVCGLRFAFEDEDMAVFFKFRWSAGL